MTGNDSRLELEQKLSQRLTQQQLRYVRLLELNAPEMDEAVEHELEANPALEAEDEEETTPTTGADDGWDAATARRSRDTFLARRDSDADDRQFAPRDDSETLADVLERQVAERDVKPEVASVARYIIGNLDGNGWLTRSLPQMLTDMAVSHDMFVDDATGRNALELVRSLDPAGVGAESLADCLLLQLRRLPHSTVRQDAIDILTRFFREYSMRHSHKIISGLHISRERLDRANRLILSLNPKPGAPFGGNDATLAGVISPDFAISGSEDQLTVQVLHRFPELSIEQSFAEAMRGMEGRRGRPKKGTEFVASRFNDARDFIALVRLRQNTLMSVMTAILNHQRPYFESGDVYDLRPMTLRDLSEATGHDISYVSRATANKYVAMPWGEVLPLRSFFSGDINSGSSSPSPHTDAAKPGQTPENVDLSASSSGHAPEEAEETPSAADALTNRQIQQSIADLVEAEDPHHPLSDEKLRRELLRKGYDVSRRTVAKYRDRSGIPVARLRKQF